MKKHGNALTAAHTPAYAAKQMSGTWAFHDPQLEPVAEIYQGFRRSSLRSSASQRQTKKLRFDDFQGPRVIAPLLVGGRRSRAS